MMNPYNPERTESHEHLDSPHSDAIESSERLDLPHPSPMDCSERFSLSDPSALETGEWLGLSDVGNPIETNDLRVPLQSSSSKDARRQIEADELREVLKAETGYSSYADYLKAYSKIHPYLKNLLYALDRVRRLNMDVLESTITVLDVMNGEDSQLRVVPRIANGSAANVVMSDIVMSLRQPPANVAVQILLWNDDGHLSEDRVDALGLGLKINPSFFGALCSPGEQQLNSGYVKIGGAVATIVRQYKPDRPDAVPIVLVARMGSPEWFRPRADTAKQQIGDVLPFQFPAVKTYQLYQPPGWWEHPLLHARILPSGEQDHAVYYRIFELGLEKEEQAADGADFVLKPLIPLLYLNIFRIRDLYQEVHRDYHRLRTNIERDRIVSGLPDKRLQLRALVEDSEDDLAHFRTYIRSQGLADWMLRNSWLKVEADLRSTHQEAGRLEAQVRDFLQLQVGEWALQESKKSIELSNRQIEEGRRG